MFKDGDKVKIGKVDWNHNVHDKIGTIYKLTTHESRWYGTAFRVYLNDPNCPSVVYVNNNEIVAMSSNRSADATDPSIRVAIDDPYPVLPNIPGERDCNCGVMSHDPMYDSDHEVSCPRYKAGGRYV